MRLDTFVFKRVDGCELRADVYRPDDEVVRPVVVWIHGGALIMGSRTRINPDHRDRYLAAGFAVVAIDYRLAPETLLPAIAEDIRDAFAWIRGEGAQAAHLAPERIAVVGHSAGGYLTLLSGCVIEPRPHALVAFYGYGDIAGDWYSQPDPFYCQEPLVAEVEARAAVGNKPLADAPDLLGQTRRSFYLWCRQQGRWPHEVVGADPHTEPEAFEPWCPVRHVDADYPPTLLLHGDNDTDVPYAQSVMMAEALARAGVEHEFITIPGGGHGFERDMADQPVVQQAFERALAFLSHHLAGTGDLIRRFADGADHLATTVADLPAEALRSRPSADDWSPAEILAHLADAEVLAAERFRRIIADPDAQIAPLDQVNWAEQLRYTERDPAIALATFRALRAANVELLRLVAIGAWSRTGHHRTLGPTSLHDQVESFADHTEEHIAQIAAATSGELLDIGDERVLRCAANGPLIDNVRTAIDLIGDAMSEGATLVAVPVSRLSADFFQLRTGMAGEIVLKFGNYRLKLAIVGDITDYLAASNALRDWVRESNRSREIWFVPTFEDLTTRLGAAAPSRSGE